MTETTDKKVPALSGGSAQDLEGHFSFTGNIETKTECNLTLPNCPPNINVEKLSFVRKNSNRNIGASIILVANMYCTWPGP